MIAPRAARILVAESDEPLRRSCTEILERAGYEVREAKSADAALEAIRHEPFAIVIAAGGAGPEGRAGMAERLLEERPGLPLIALVEMATLERAGRALGLGAADFLLQPVQEKELIARVANSIARREPSASRARARAAPRGDSPFGAIVGASPAIEKIYRIVERVAELPAVVLIEGEPGTGKELVARSIHERAAGAAGGGDAAAAADYPYVAVNCGALSRTLLESQLFGHKKGTFTGAVADQVGVFVAAGRGTLFLDEITELDLDLQVKLLRALQEREVTPLGATQPIAVDARIITATNRDIGALVKAGTFRADLYYRINVINIRVPPLRERSGDIPLLAGWFSKATAERYGIAPRALSESALAAMMSYPWPGNVRELQNVVERAFALGEHERVISLEDLPPEIAGGGLAKHSGGNAGLAPFGTSAFLSYDQAIRLHLLRALEASRGVRTRAADLLGIDRNRLYRLLQKYRIGESEQGAARGPRAERAPFAATNPAPRGRESAQ
ncbi:MAG: sigma-54 dependent transcriptional regulator [Planctomycetes bacterium]|nr:sigma-54 dependent transcriptional regulator [Planctomycetota bacterium]